MDDGTETEAVTEDKKVEKTGWTQRIEVLCLGDGDTQADAVNDATSTMAAFLDYVRDNPKLYLVNAPDAKFGTRKIGAQA